MDNSVPGKLAEKGVLAGLFDNPHDINLVMSVLSAEDFSEPRNAVIYAAMSSASEKGEALDPVSIASNLESNQELSRVGGIAYLTELIDPAALHSYDTDLLGYAKIVKEHSQLRQVKMLAKKLDQIASPDSGKSADEIMSMADTELRNVVDVIVQSDAQLAGDLVYDVLDSLEERGKLADGATLGVPSSFIDLDSSTTGWKPGQFIIVAARPGQGKTTIALDFVRAASIKAGLTSMFFSLEMSKPEIMEKLLSAEARVEATKVKTGKLSADEWQSLQNAAEKIQASNLIIDDSPEITIPHVRAAAIKQKARPEGLDMVVLDYIQLLSSPNRVESRQQEVSQFSRSLKLLAKELGVPVIALSQLNRASEQRQDKTPLPSDLRESGSLEQDADIILLLHRPEYYDEHDRPGQAILDIAKHRGGPTGKITLISLLQYSKFANGAGIAPPPVDSEPPNEGTPPPPEEYPPDDYTPSEGGAAW